MSHVLVVKDGTLDCPKHSFVHTLFSTLAVMLVLLPPRFSLSHSVGKAGEEVIDGFAIVLTRKEMRERRQERKRTEGVMREREAERERERERNKQDKAPRGGGEKERDLAIGQS